MRIFAPKPATPGKTPAAAPALAGRAAAHPTASRSPQPATPAAAPSPSAPARDFSRVPVRSPQRAAAGGGAVDRAPPIVHDVVRSPGRPLDPATRAFFEPRFGADFSQVRIHTDEKAAESARAVRALAYTVGQDVVVGEGRFAPRTADGRRLLAHELAHTVQQGAAPGTAPMIGAPDTGHEREAERAAADVGRGARAAVSRNTAAAVVARAPAPVQQATGEERREVVDMAARWLAAQATQIQALRTRAAAARTAAAGAAAAARAYHQHLNQEVVAGYLRGAIEVFEAQRSDNPHINFPAESPEQTRLGEGYARAMEQLGLAMEEARANAANLAPAVQQSEDAAYARNHLRWMEANPSAPLAAGIRTTFTQTEQDVSARRRTQTSAQFASLAANVHRYNLAGDGAARLRQALLDSTYHLERDAATGMVRASPDAALQTSIQPILDQLSAIEWAIGQALDRLRRAEARTRAFAADPAANRAAGDTLHTHFFTRDPGYATLLADRLARMRRELGGQGALTVHARNPADPNCGAGSVGSGFSVTAAHAGPNRFHFCGSVRVGDDDVVSTVIHETVHAVIPNLGANASVSAAADTPGDRAYAFERIYSRMTTEEALDNAESYAYFVDALLGVAVSRPTAPTDVITGCTDTAPVLDAIARATYRIRLGAMWASQNDTVPLQQFVVDIVQVGFPGADEARARQIVGHMRELSARLAYYLPVSCRRATDPEAAAGALAYGQSTRVTAGGVAATGRTWPAGTLRLAPAWFQAGTAVQEDALTSILVPHYRPTVAAGDIAGIVTLLRHIQQEAQPSPSGRTLQQHQAADAPPPPRAPAVPAPGSPAPAPVP